MTVDPGVWSGSPRLALQWRRNGSPIPGGTDPIYVPVDSDDLTDLTCTIAAVNAAGSASAGTPSLFITHVSPGALGLPDVNYVQDSGVQALNAISGFTGAALRFGVTGDGVSIDPETGQLVILTDALRDGIEVLVTATNSGGVATNTFRLTVSAVVDDAAVAPALVAAPTLSGTGKIGMGLSLDPGIWSGQPAPDLALQWRRDGVAIPGATTADYLPVAADDLAEISCAVTASNAAGSLAAVTDPVRVTQVAPVAAGSLGDLELEQGSGAFVVPMAPHFSGAALSFAVTGAGASIDAATGVLSLPTDTAMAAALVTVTVTNSGGSATDSFQLTVSAAVDDAAVAPAWQSRRR